MWNLVPLSIHCTKQTNMHTAQGSGTHRRWNPFADARHFQIAFLGSFLAYGLIALDWQADWMRYAITLATALGIQAVAIVTKSLPWSTLKSALITGLGLSLLLKSGVWWAPALAAAAAIGSKFLIRYKGKHLFNPANLGVVVALLTGQAWVSPGQWGAGPALVFLIGACGWLVLIKATRLDTALAFITVFAALIGWRQLGYLGWPADHLVHTLTNGSLLLFTFFMITDPRTTPNARVPRLIWAALIAVTAFFLHQQWYVHTAPILALFLLTPLVPLADHFWKAKKFEWLPGNTATAQS